MDYISEVKNILSEKFNNQPLANVVTFGCAQNENDSEKVRGLLAQLGYAMTDTLDESDIVIYNTCAIREYAELKIFGNIGKLKALKAAKPDMIVAVCGCMVMQQHIVDKIKKSYPFVDIVFGVNNLEVLPLLMYKRYTEGKKQILPPQEKTDIVENTPILRSGKSKASVSIMFGCDNFCSYCIVPYARGPVRSRSIENIVKEATRLSNKGFKEIVLTGISVNSYGKDLCYAVGYLCRLIRILGNDRNLHNFGVVRGSGRNHLQKLLISVRNSSLVYDSLESSAVREYLTVCLYQALRRGYL